MNDELIRKDHPWTSKRLLGGLGHTKIKTMSVKETYFKPKVDSILLVGSVVPLIFVLISVAH